LFGQFLAPRDTYKHTTAQATRGYMRSGTPCQACRVTTGQQPFLGERSVGTHSEEMTDVGVEVKKELGQLCGGIETSELQSLSMHEPKSNDDDYKVQELTRKD
jgi:hypothetical protein